MEKRVIRELIGGSWIDGRVGNVREKGGNRLGLSLLGEVVVPIMRWERFVGGSGLANRIKSFVFDMLIVKCL